MQGASDLAWTFDAELDYVHAPCQSCSQAACQDSLMEATAPVKGLAERCVCLQFSALGS